MDVIVDSCVWSLALRRKNPSTEIRDAVADLISQSKICMLGPICQECLSGVNDADRYATLRDFFRNLPDALLTTEDYELAASFYNRCRSKGVQGSHIDFLICAGANRRKCELYTTDIDFDRYAPHIPIRRFKA